MAGALTRYHHRMKRVSRLVIVVLIVLAINKWGKPWYRQHYGSGAAASTTGAQKPVENECVQSAQAASEAWGSGLKSFVNPPYDLNAWSSFRGDVESKITTAERGCTCADPSCEKVRDAMRDLRSLVSDLDNAIRSGGSPGSDIVQRQEAIDNRIDEAADLVRQGK